MSFSGKGQGTAIVSVPLLSSLGGSEMAPHGKSQEQEALIMEAIEHLGIHGLWRLPA